MTIWSMKVVCRNPLPELEKNIENESFVLLIENKIRLTNPQKDNEA